MAISAITSTVGRLKVLTQPYTIPVSELLVSRRRHIVVGPIRGIISIAQR